MATHIKQLVKNIIDFCRRHKKDVAQIIVATALAFVLSKIIVIDLTDISSYISTSNADIEMSDLYNAIADRRSLRTLSNDIVIVSSDECTREDITTIIHQLGIYDIKAIGLDVIYQYPELSDSTFIREVELSGKVVLPYILQLGDNDNVVPLYCETFENVHNAKTGYVNLESNDLHGVIRSYKTSVYSSKSTFNSFDAAIAVTGDTSLNLYTNTVASELIYFPSTKFEVVRGMDLLTCNSNDSVLQNTFNGKYVIIGDMGNVKDSFITPIDDEMAGVVVHAYILNTIINRLSSKVTPEWMCWLIATIVCFVFIAINVCFDKKNSKLNCIIRRALQIVMLYCLIIIGVKLFVDDNIYTDFAPTLLMVSFGLISTDIVIGVCEVVRLVITKHKSK